MITWMQHPEHGKMPCYDKTTIDQNKRNGWAVVEDITAPKVQDEPAKPKRGKK